MKQTVYHTGLVCTGSALMDIKQEWCELSTRCIDASLHHDWYWHHALSVYLSRNIQYLTIRFGTTLIAVVPLDLTQTKSLRGPACNETPLADMLLDPNHCTPELFTVLVQELTRHAPQWRTLKLSNLPENSAWLTMIALVKWPSHREQSGTNAYFRNDGDEGLNPPKKLKRNLTRLHRRLTDQYGEPTLCAGDLNDYLSVNQHSWKQLNSRTGLVSDEQARTFYESLLSSYGLSDRAWVSIMKIGDVAISAQLGLRYGRCFSLLKITYHEDFAAFGVGSQHLWKALEWAQTQPLDTVNLTTGPGWADRWHPDRRPVYELCLYRKSLFGYGNYGFEKIKTRLRPLKKAIQAGIRRVHPNVSTSSVHRGHHDRPVHRADAPTRCDSGS
ncbi:GNAT family N-acetyltransferase [Reinekea blandensis]|uniref:BioF2-like acetyltransferase domain-containing protein n=1 Tax=Reinekea blandensis MED297 TaxID=314283 RepID=A4B954_9GAMM|nr:GNAT family N-acetyltransferase [Reinekea blandensis]EAR11155.1 hypothetical protein MED297_19747 [Reinekea sp. MED297] [Reinekea blandensis MED297]